MAAKVGLAPVATSVVLWRPTAGPPLDYSFKGLKTVNQVLQEQPTSGVPRNPPVRGHEQLTATLLSLEEPRAEKVEDPTINSSSNKATFNSNGIRLCNNNLTSLAGLEKILSHVMDDPNELVW